MFVYNYKLESIVEEIGKAEKNGQLGSYKVSVVEDVRNGHLVDFEGKQLTPSD